MRFSMKTEYGVRAILELAANTGKGSLQSAEIARRQAIPGPFLDQVLMTLRRAGMIRSTRGPHGGHALARRPEEIRLDEVVECLEGNARDNRQEGAGNGEALVLAQVSEKAEMAARQVFAAHSLADCLRMRHQQPPVFHGIFHPAGARPRSR
jgi:Rrf2 family transcriptional regulator, cysteine metabolism repressor